MVLRVLASTVIAVGVALAAHRAMAPEPPSAARGAEVFVQCEACHAATTTEKRMGPSLKGLFRKPKLVNGQKPTEVTVLELINKGKGSMPAFSDVLSTREKSDILAYLKTL